MTRPAASEQSAEQERHSTREARWTLGDALDFECALESTKSGDDIAARGGAALREDSSPLPLAEVPRRALFRRWLELRRRESPDLPGAALDRTLRVARLAMWTLGIVLGFSSAGGYLLYFGKEPVNPFWFLLWLVAFPLILSVFALLACRAVQDWSGPGAIARWLLEAVCRRLPGHSMRTCEAWSGALARHRKRLAPLAVPPLLGLTQRLACAFGAGALLALWLRVIFTDLAFGWQSTDWPAERWHGIARVMAMPWTWAFPAGCPTLEEVRASQFTHAGGMAAIDPAAARAWWPFLVGCLAVWSVGLRGLFIACLEFMGRRALAGIDFHHSDGNALARHLAGPLISSPDYPPSGAPPAVRSHPAHSHAAGSWLVLVADGVPADSAELGAGIAAVLGGTLSRVEPIEIDDSGANGSTFATIANSPERVAVVLPAATDPIGGIKKTLQQIGVACAGREWVVVLRGDPARFPLWQKFSDAARLDLDLAMWPVE